MIRKIYGYSINEKMTKGREVYGKIGYLIGIIYKDKNNLCAILMNEQNQYTTREAIIDIEAYVGRRGVEIKQDVILSKVEENIDMEILKEMNKSLAKKGDLSLVKNGEVNVRLGMNNAVFIAKNNVFNYFKECKQNYPTLPLTYAEQAMPYQKNKSYVKSINSEKGKNIK